jgi:hypothetical protein
MEAWCSKVRNMKDDSEDSYLTHKIVLKLFDELRDMKRYLNRERLGKFKNQMGPDYDRWVFELETDAKLPEDTLTAILRDEEFWELTWAALA